MIARLIHTAQANRTHMVGDAIGLAAICVMIVSSLML